MLDFRKWILVFGYDRVLKRFVNLSESGNFKGEFKGNLVFSEVFFCIFVVCRFEELEFFMIVNEVGYLVVFLGVKVFVNVVFGVIFFFNVRFFFVVLWCVGRESGEVVVLVMKSLFLWCKGGYKGGFCWGKGKVD